MFNDPNVRLDAGAEKSATLTRNDKQIVVVQGNADVLLPGKRANQGHRT